MINNSKVYKGFDLLKAFKIFFVGFICLCLCVMGLGYISMSLSRKKCTEEVNAVVVENVKKADVGFGFDASKEQYVDMKKSGIVDPTKVTRSALENATSIASMVITTESLVTDAPEKQCCHNHGGDTPEMPDMGGMY